MNLKLWRFFNYFLMFENVISIIKTAKNRFHTSFCLKIMYNLLLSSLIFFVAAFMSVHDGGLGAYIRSDISNVQNVSELFTKIFYFFPLMAMSGYICSLWLLFYQKQFKKFAKTFMKVICESELDFNSQYFSQFEFLCFFLWVTSQFLVDISILINNISIGKGTMLSLIVLSCMSWTTFTTEHFLFFYVVATGLMAVVVRKMKHDLVNVNTQKSDYLEILERLNIVGQVIHNMHSQFGNLITFAWIKVIIEAQIRVS